MESSWQWRVKWLHSFGWEQDFIVGTKDLKLEAKKDHKETKCHKEVKITQKYDYKMVAGKTFECLVELRIHQPLWPVMEK